MNIDSDDIERLVKAAERVGRLANLIFWIILIIAAGYAVTFGVGFIVAYDFAVSE